MTISDSSNGLGRSVFSFDYQGVIFALCDKLTDSGCIDLAIRHMETLLEIFPGSLPTMEMLGRYHCLAGRVDDACSVLEKLLFLHPYHRGAHLILLELALAASPGSERRFDGHVDGALSNWPFDEEIVLLGAGVLRKRGDAARSRAILERFLGAGYPGSGGVHAALGELHRELDGPERLAAFVAGTEWAKIPLGPVPRVRLAGLLLDADLRSSLVHLKEAISSPSPDVLLGASGVLERIDMDEDAWRLSYDVLIRNGSADARTRCLRLENGGKVRSVRPVTISPSGRPLVVFVSEWPRMREAQFAQALRIHGFDVVLLYRKSPNYDVSTNFSEAVRFENPQHALYFAQRYRPLAYHVFSMAGDQTSFLLTKEKPGRIVFDPNDIFEGGNGCDPSDLLSTQRFCLENADALCFRDRQAALARNRHGYILPPRNVLMEEYCWRREPLPEIDGEKLASDPIHVVSLGFFNVEKVLPGRIGYLEVAKRLAADKVHLHLYPSWFYCETSDAKWANDFEDYIRLERETGYFHLYRPVPMERVISEICRYDFAITADQPELFPPHRSHLPPSILATCGSSRLMDYLEAGLPVIITRNLAYQFRRLDRLGIAVEAGPDFLDHPREILSAYRTPQIKRKVREAREREDIMRHIPRLAAFYRSLS